MALVKKSALGARKRAPAPLEPAEEAPPAAAGTPAHTSPARTRTPQAKPARRSTAVSDRIDQAVQELASGLAESAAAAAQLQRAVEQISSGAEEAAGAAQESLGLIANLRAGFRDANERAATALRQSERIQTGFAEVAAQIDTSVAAIMLNAQRQMGSVVVVERLEQAAQGIATVGATVGDLSEQTSMLAINAAIEAERAGDAGKAFAIVADEVRALADSADRNAGEIQALAGAVLTEIRSVADRIRASAQLAGREAEGGREVVGALRQGRADLSTLIAGAQDIAAVALEAEIAATEAERGAEEVAGAAEEQSAAAAEALQAIDQQTLSLDQSQQAAETLGTATTGLEQGTVGTAGKAGNAAEEVAAAAEELSATMQELSGASGQILVAVEQIARGAQVQSSATLQAATAMGQIDQIATLAAERARDASRKAEAVLHTSRTSRTQIAGLVAGMTEAVTETRGVLDHLTRVGDTARKIETIADGLALLALQTNMLAVTGAIEATRAGDARMGFTTVTSDIRKLARESAANAEEAKAVVHAIQDQLTTVRRDLDQIAGAAEAEAGRNQVMIERFEGIAIDLAETAQNNAAIIAGADTIQQAVREVRLGCDQIAAAAQIAADAAREAGTAARQQTQVAEDLAAAIEDIASLATALSMPQARGT